jgi:uncharacterized protein (DUF885 family)
MQKGHHMGQLEELEQRIADAFSRISAGVVALSAAPAAPAEPSPDLQEALDEERMANAQLHERVRVLQGQLDGARSSQQDQVASLTAQLEAQALEVQRLTSTASRLRDELQQLRGAAEQGAVDPSMINGAMMAELEALRTTRAAEATEMNDILSALGQVLDAEEARTHA